MKNNMKTEVLENKPVPQKPARIRKIIIKHSIRPEVRKAVFSLLEYFSGNREIEVVVEGNDDGADKVMRYNVFLNDKIIERLIALVGRENIS